MLLELNVKENLTVVEFFDPLKLVIGYLVLSIVVTVNDVIGSCNSVIASSSKKKSKSYSKKENSITSNFLFT